MLAERHVGKLVEKTGLSRLKQCRRRLFHQLQREGCCQRLKTSCQPKLSRWKIEELQTGQIGRMISKHKSIKLDFDVERKVRDP